MKLSILYRPTSEWRTRNDVALHSLDPTYGDLLSRIDDAVADGFTLIVVYSDKPRAPRHNIFASGSTWNRLRRDVSGGDVRYGEVLGAWNVPMGEGFTVYLQDAEVDDEAQ